MNPNGTTPRPWYREPWPWLLAAGPVIVVIAALYTYHLAANRNKPSLVTDDYYREGKNIALYMERDEEAQKRHLRADVLISPDGNRIKVLLAGRVLPEEVLKLSFIHPTRSQYDRSITLQGAAAAADSDVPVEYTAETEPLPPAHHWYVRVEDHAGLWRIQGKWLTNQGGRVVLEPMHQGGVSAAP